jgi:hypothetical protein
MFGTFATLGRKKYLPTLAPDIITAIINGKNPPQVRPAQTCREGGLQPGSQCAMIRAQRRTGGHRPDATCTTSHRRAGDAESKITTTPRGFPPWRVTHTPGAEAMSHTNLSRRAMLAGASAVPILTLPGVALASAKAIAAPAVSPVAVDVATLVPASAAPRKLAQDPDPIFALIERHRSALIFEMEKSSVTAHMNSKVGGPKYRAAEKEQGSAWDAVGAVELEMVGAPPTTLAGVLALLAHVDDLFAQRIVLPSDPKNWHSMYESLGNYFHDDVVSPFNGAPVSLPFYFWIMRNVRAVLETSELPGRSPIAVTRTMPAPRSSATDEKLIDMESNAISRRDRLKRAGDAHDAAEGAMQDWSKGNPEPTEAKALARWKSSERRALKRCGYAKKEKDWHSEIHSFDNFLRRVAVVPAASISGLQCKARLLEMNDGFPEELEESISRDLLAMGSA